MSDEADCSAQPLFCRDSDADPTGTLARRLFQLQTLNEASFELSRLASTDEIADSFLLTAMGALGAMQGFVLVISADGSRRVLSVRGFPEAETEGLRGDPARVMQTYCSAVKPGQPAPPSRPHILFAGKGGSPTLFPTGTAILVKWVLDEECGFVGLGAKLKDAYTGDDRDFLISLTATFQHFLGRASFLEEIHRLNDGLLAGNTELQESLAASRRLGKELDRRIYHLKSVNDTVNELSGLLDSGELMQRFLLLAMGAVSAARGYLALFSQSGDKRRLVSRGMEESSLAGADGPRISRLVTRMLFSGAQGCGSDGLRRGLAEDADVLTQAGLPADMPGVWFVVDDTRFGFMGLGERLSATAFDPLECDFLLTATGAFTIFLRNAGLYEEKTRLIDSLASQNRELQDTLDCLTRSRQEVDVLKAAKQRITELVRCEMDRVGRVSIMDFVLILCVSLAIGILFNSANPSGVSLIPAGWGRPPIQAVDPSLARARLDQGGAIIVDARPREFYEQKHIPGAVNLPLSLFDFVYGMEMADMDLAREVVVYGGNISRRYDDDVAALLIERGHSDVKVLSGGLDAWENRGFPVGP
ncbi:cyclic nucleotide-binding protein [hydrocarbon metagenome]|uniref:Cyclic nucleotide-binding protein n=1 Tax=hydrocarbon metagenome TaxID=938273 RepID=A0A0W8G534_9ZZZZ